METPYSNRPQSSGKVECINRTFKITLANLCQETQSPWVDMLPLALLRARYTPRPSEILYGRPPPIINRLGGTSGKLEVQTCLDISRP
jgi:hypothetical protein